MSLTKVTYSMIDGTYLNVKDFGAKGDSTTDDTAAIQACLDASEVVAGTSGRAIFFPSGNYRFSNLELPARCDLYGESMNNTVLRRTDTATGIAIKEKSSATRIVITNMTIAGQNRPGDLLNLGNVTGDPAAFNSGALLDNLILRNCEDTLLDLNANVGWIGRLWAFNDQTASGSPLVIIRGSDSTIEHLEIFNNVAATQTAIQVRGANNYFGRLYIEGSYAKAIEFAANSTRHHFTDIKISLSSSLSIADLITFAVGAAQNKLDNVLVTQQSGTTVTNSINDSALGIVLPTSERQIQDVPFSYNQTATEIDAAYNVSGTFGFQPNKKYGVVIQNAAGTVTLPRLASSRGQVYTVVNASSVNVNVITNPSDPVGTLINGVAGTYALAAKYNSVSLVSNGTEWFVISSN